MLAPLFGTPSLLILDLSTPTPPSNPISKLTGYVLQAFLAPNNTIHALLIHIYMFILAPKLFCITLHYITRPVCAASQRWWPAVEYIKVNMSVHGL